ncbi:MAG TPA: carboxypeptidase-like regulatory domain-containing protein [Thermoanaerobaculia bacterium]
MRKALASAVLLSLAIGIEPAASAVRLSDFLSVLGRVTASTRPARDVLIVAFNLGDFQAWQTSTDSDGSFRLPPLPAGVYRIIAVKQGFAPAIATIAPNRTDHLVALKLRPGAKITNEDRDQIWEIRRSLPPDILRKLDLMLAETNTAAAAFHGQMASVTSVAPERSTPSFAQTAVGISGALGRGWAVDVKGNFHVVNPVEDQKGPSARIAQASDVSMEISSSDDLYRFVSTRKSWQVSEDLGTNRAGDFENHRFEWNRANTRVALRYFAQENLFIERRDSEMVELSGETVLQQSARSDFAIQLRVGQESLASPALTVQPLRVADLAASGRFDVVDAVSVHYGVRTRFANERYEWAPATAAEVKLAKKVSLIVSALYKMLEETALVDTPPSIVVLDQMDSLTPRSRYSIGLIAGDPAREGSLSAIVTMTEVDSLVRLAFDERFEPWWEGLALEPGDVHQDVAVALRKHVGKRFAFDLSTSAGRAQGVDTDSIYFIGSLQSLYRPSGTSVDVSYRRVDEGALTEIEKLNLRMGQSLRLPLDLRLLLGIDLARSAQPLFIESGDADAIQRRLVGGVSLAF